MTKTINVFSVIWVDLTRAGLPSVTTHSTEESALASFRAALADLQSMHPGAATGFGLSSRVGAVSRSAGLFIGDPRHPKQLGNVTLRSHEIETHEAPQGWGEVEAGSPVRGTVGAPEEA